MRGDRWLDQQAQCSKGRGSLIVVLGIRNDVPQYRRGITHLASDPERSLGQQVSVYSAFCSFARVCPLRWYWGVDLARLLSRPNCAAAAVQASCDLHGFFLLARYHESRDIDEASRELHKGGSFSSQMLVDFYKHQIKILSERKDSFPGIQQKMGNVARMCLETGAGINFFLDIAG